MQGKRKERKCKEKGMQGKEGIKFLIRCYGKKHIKSSLERAGVHVNMGRTRTEVPIREKDNKAASI